MYLQNHPTGSSVCDGGLFFSSKLDGHDAMSFKRALVGHRENQDEYEKFAARSEGIGKAMAGCQTNPAEQLTAEAEAHSEMTQAGC
jgi:pyridoxal biosynthesis lyase PdxS